MSRTTFEYHWRKHHRTYVDNLNKQIVGTQLDEFTLEDIILTTYNKGNLLPPFNNAAQVRQKKKKLEYNLVVYHSASQSVWDGHEMRFFNKTTHICFTIDPSAFQLTLWL